MRTMRAARVEKSRPSRQDICNAFAEKLVDNNAQLERYDRAKWNLLGHANKDLRFAGHHPWPKRTDARGIERTLSVPVFSGYSPETESVMVVRKDPWTHPNDPQSWLVAEQNLATGNYVEPKILSASIDAARHLWLQLAPANFDNWPGGLHPALFARPYEQIRIEGRLDAAWHLDTAEYREGLRKQSITYEDIEGLESMIVAVQQKRWAAWEDELGRARLQQETAMDMGLRAVTSLDHLPLAS